MIEQGGTFKEAASLSNDLHDNQPNIQLNQIYAPRHVDYVNLTLLEQPRFIITVDTEEEFDWAKPLGRDSHSMHHVQAIEKFQTLCEKYHISPIYLVDWPIAHDPAAIEMLGGFAKAGKASIGVQLHAWVNPPFDETLSNYNSYACNLPLEYERAKLLNLVDAITKNFGIAPQIYRAGRYGFGSRTSSILKEAGIAIDSSFRPRFDYSANDGPNYASSPIKPYWHNNGVMELPLTTVFSGLMRNHGDGLFSKSFEASLSRSLLSRSGLIERIALTPEGIPIHKAIRGIDRALEEGIGIINISLHSPSLDIGHTPYVKDQKDLVQLYDWLEQAFNHLALRNVNPVGLEEILEKIIR